MLRAFTFLPTISRVCAEEGIDVAAAFARLRRVSPDKRLSCWEFTELARSHFMLKRWQLGDEELKSIHDAVGSNLRSGRVLIDDIEDFINLRPSSVLRMHTHTHTGDVELDSVVVRDADVPLDAEHELALDVAARVHRDMKRRALVPSEVYHWIDHPDETNHVSLRRVRSGLRKCLGIDLTVDETAKLFALVGVARKKGRLTFQQFAKLFDDTFLDRSHLLFGATGGIAAIFERASETGDDSRLTMATIRTVARKLVAASYGPKGADVERLFRFADTDKSGSMDFHEFRGAIHLARMAVDDLAVATIFCLIDEDSDGSLTLDEIRKFLSVHGRNIWVKRNCPQELRYSARAPGARSPASSAAPPAAAPSDGRRGSLALSNAKLLSLQAAPSGPPKNSSRAAGRRARATPSVVSAPAHGSTTTVSVCAARSPSAKKLAMSVIARDQRRDDALKIARIVRMTVERMSLSPSEAFRLVDDDRSDSLGASEFARGLCNLGLEMTRAQSKLLFRLLDIDGDERISFHEFQTLFKAKQLQNDHLFRGVNRPLSAVEAELKRTSARALSGAQLREIAMKVRAASYTIGGSDLSYLFRFIDEDHDGCISFQELRRALRRARVSHEALSDVQIAQLYRVIDEDESRSIEMEELQAWVDRNAPLVEPVSDLTGRTIAPPPGLDAPAAPLWKRPASPPRRATPQERARKLTPQQAALLSPQRALRTLACDDAFAALSPDVASELSAAALAAIGASVARGDGGGRLTLFPDAPASPRREQLSRAALRRPWGSSPASPASQSRGTIAKTGHTSPIFVNGAGRALPPAESAYFYRNSTFEHFA
jgi:Ca2+-binding EF-hand superfamily protein